MKGRPSGWKQKIAHEMIEYWINFVYLVFFLGAFTWYRRLILAQDQISYLHYGISLFEALILAKVILIGDALRLGRGLEDRPLIIPTLYKAVVFTLLVGAFGFVEHTIGGMASGKGLAGGLAELGAEGRYGLFARCLVTFVAFVPFFAFKELGRVLDEGNIGELFFRRKGGEASAPTNPKNTRD